MLFIDEHIMQVIRQSIIHSLYFLYVYKQPPVLEYRPTDNMGVAKFPFKGHTIYVSRRSQEKLMGNREVPFTPELLELQGTK
jgi:hypothetical protein